MVQTETSDDDDEVVTVILQTNVLEKLLGIVFSHEDEAVLMAVYSLLARLTSVSTAVVSRIMVPAFLSKSLSRISTVNDGLTLQVLHVLYQAALTEDDFGRFEVKSDVTSHLLQYLRACQPSSVGRNERSCCGTLELEESRKWTVSMCLLLLTALIKVSFPDDLKEEVVTACVPYFPSRDRHVQLLALKYARHFVSDSENEYFLQFPLPNNQMNPEDTTWIPVIDYLVDLVKEKRMDFDQNVRVFHVFRRVCADIREQLGHPERASCPEIFGLRTIEGEVMSLFPNCLKTIGTILAIFGELSYFSEELEQIVIDSGIYELLGELLSWSIVVTDEGTPPPLMSAGADYEYFRTAVETDSQLEDPFHLLEPLRTAYRQHNFQRPLAYRDSIQHFILDDTMDDTISVPHLLKLNWSKDSLLKNVLFILGNALGGTPAHVEIVLLSLFPGLPATEATMKVIEYLQAIISRLPLKSMVELMRCVYLLASMPTEHQFVLIRSEMLQLAWNHRGNLNTKAANYLVHSFKRLLSPNNESSHTVATALLEQFTNESFVMELDRMCDNKYPTLRKCYCRLRTFLETLPKQSLLAVP